MPFVCIDPFTEEFPQEADGIEDCRLPAAIASLEQDSLPCRLGKRSARNRDVMVERFHAVESQTSDVHGLLSVSRLGFGPIMPLFGSYSLLLTQFQVGRLTLPRWRGSRIRP